MSEQANLDTIEPGMTVYGVDGEEIGAVETVDAAGITTAGREVPRAAIARVEGERVHLQVAKMALLARRDPDVEPAEVTAAHQP